MTEDQDPVRSITGALEALSAEVKTTGAIGRIALCALAQSSPRMRDLIEAALDVEVLDRRTAGGPADLVSAASLLRTRASLCAPVSLTTDGETLERVLIAAARHV
jgi:hypothetical protein